MILRTITLRQFRSHLHLELAVDAGVNLFLGPNGAGKTNIIEAVSVLATGVSPRGAEPDEMSQWGTNGFAVLGEFISERAGAEPLKLEMKYKLGSTRVVRENDTTAVRLRDLLGRVPLVCFVPEDLSLVKGEPEVRRKAMSMVLAQVDPVYAEAIRRYTEALRSRNAALRQIADGQLSNDALEPWDEAVIDWGLKVARRRAEFIEEFAPEIIRIHADITGGKESVALQYKPSIPTLWGDDTVDQWRLALAKSLAHDLAVGSTGVGPHRDDLVFLVDGHAARAFASEGQKRTCAVAFKLAEIPFIQGKLNQTPICLLDDVLSELDADRARNLLTELSRTGQCFVTLTGLESWPKDCGLPAAIYRVDANGVRRDMTPTPTFLIEGQYAAN